jgi:choline dehydrogenase-like flavoprotein
MRTNIRRVHFEGDRAVGAEDWCGNVYHGRQAVVLSAGLFGTFDALIESGIGPAQALKARNVEPRVVNEYVGKGVGAETPLVVKYISAERRAPHTVEPSLAAHSSTLDASLCWWSDGLFTWWAQRSNFLSWMPISHSKNPGFLSRIHFVAVSLPNGPPRLHLEATATSVVLNDDALEFTQQMCDGFAELAPVLRAGFAAVESAGAALTGWAWWEYRSLTTFLWAITPVLHYLKIGLLTLPNILTSFDLRPQCVKTELADYYHYYGGSGAGVVDEQYAVRHVKGLYVSDASILRSLKPGGPTATVMQQGVRVAEAMAHELHPQEVSTDLNRSRN